MLSKSQSHEVVLEIDEAGKVSTTVHGVDGPACGDLTKWLEQLGVVEVDSPTDDYRKQGRQGITISR
jgi:hypothetical protein